MDEAKRSQELARRDFARAFSGAEREAAQLAIAAMDAVRESREQAAVAFEECARAVELSRRRAGKEAARARELRKALARAEEETQRARRAEAAATARLQALLQQPQHAAVTPASRPSPSAAHSPSLASPGPDGLSAGSTPTGSRTGKISSRISSGPVRVQLRVGLGARGARSGQHGVLLLLLVDWPVCPTWGSVGDHRRTAHG